MLTVTESDGIITGSGTVCTFRGDTDDGTDWYAYAATVFIKGRGVDAKGAEKILKGNWSAILEHLKWEKDTALDVETDDISATIINGAGEVDSDEIELVVMHNSLSWLPFE